MIGLDNLTENVAALVGKLAAAPGYMPADQAELIADVIAQGCALARDIADPAPPAVNVTRWIDERDRAEMRARVRDTSTGVNPAADLQQLARDEVRAAHHHETARKKGHDQ